MRTHGQWLWVAITFLSWSFVAPAVEATESGPSPVGYWKTVDDNTGKARAFVKIWQHDGKLLGRIVKLVHDPGEDPNPLCDECRGPQKNQPVLGMQILSGLEPDGDRWTNGRILDPENGKTYRCLVQVVDRGAKLKVRGYIGFSLLGRTQYWLRTERPTDAVE